ncbi:MAG: methylmalonyl-CoA mutase, partial [Caldilinea sp.]|nr:methylmalonyl-CoA mutase [Caldilinea sp.]
QQPDNNIVRVTIQALSAVLGGTQSLHTNSKDEALALPTQKSVEIALRTQQIIAYESGAADTVDPLAGSYYVEWLTDEIERRADEYIAKIDELGGALRAVEEGFVQREIQDAAYRAQRAVEKGDDVVVGVNRFQTDEHNEGELLRVDESVRINQVAALAKLRAERDNDAVQEILGRIGQAASEPQAPIMPLIVEAVEAYATLGEICDTLRGVFGEYTPENWV